MEIIGFEAIVRMSKLCVPYRKVIVMPSASDRIRSEVELWAGVTSGPHRFNGIEFMLGRAEIGHLHGDALLDIAFTIAVRDALIAEGKAQPHHIAPEAGWISFRLRTPEDAEHAIWLLRLSYLRHVLINQRKRSGLEAVRRLDVRSDLNALNLSPVLYSVFEDYINRQHTREGTQNAE
jgi:hypothetical protein